MMIDPEKAYTAAELEKIPPGTPPAMWNPFADAIAKPSASPQALKNAKAWASSIHDKPKGARAVSGAPTDPLELFLEETAESPINTAGTTLGTPQEPAGAIFGFLDKPSAEEWEEHCRRMHDQQQHINPDDLPPSDGGGAGAGRDAWHLMQSGKHKAEHEELKNFADLTPEERENILRRSD